MITKIDSFIEKFGKSNTQSILLVFSIIFTFILVYILNWIYPIAFDDWQYTFVFDEGKRIENIGDIFRSQYNHYFLWGGRSVVHMIAQFLLMLSPLLHNLLNSAALVLLLFVFYRIANYRNKTNAFIFVAIALLMWFMQPAFASVYFWITGSANYLWGMLIVILFLYPYYIYYRNGADRKGNIGLALLFLPAGIIAGWTNENMPFAIGAFILFFFYLLKREKRTIPYWSILGLVGILIGAVVMLKAPGNYVRLNGGVEATGADVSEGAITLKYLLGNIPNMLFLYFKRLLLPIVVPYMIVFYLLNKQRRNVADYKQIKYSSLMFLLAGHLAFAAMVGALEIPNRSLFGIICFFFIALFILLANLPIKMPIAKRILFVVGFLAIIGFFADYYFSKYKSYLIVKEVYKSRELQIETGKKNGQKDFVFYNKISNMKGKIFYGDGDHPDDPHYFLNMWFAQYYDISSVRIYGSDENPNNN